MIKPKLSVVITSLNSPTIKKEYNKANGLKNITIDGVSNTVPHYGIIPMAGSVQLIDKDDWIKTQSDNNILPDVSVDIYVDDVLQYSFISENEIEYKKLDKTVTINLIDQIELLQDQKRGFGSIYTDTNAYIVFSNLCFQMGISCIVDEDTTTLLKDIKIGKMYVGDTTYWDILQQFVYACRCIFYRKGGNYWLRKLEE